MIELAFSREKEASLLEKLEKKSSSQQLDLSAEETMSSLLVGTASKRYLIHGIGQQWLTTGLWLIEDHVRANKSQCVVLIWART